ncbi:hypothetical protein [Chryseobacterium gallinarum]|uniref:DUF262 domain-containing protein n=1 Tax=Chryseobacterium gallinarum TaxID=1324352 RepID=A0ABX6KQA7_CHRGL|nr:hypothetical protein [Chryseobacterium gallinarum]QIY90019.1 hypothetical protein FOB44_04805 [Chryseobacterium gallinarum]
MKIKDKIFDNRINSLNLLIETTIEEYYALSKDILDNNEFQRRRVKSSSSVYSLLKTDLRQGCVIPPIVLALSMEAEAGKDQNDDDLVNTILKHKEKLIILDGLQRTYTIRDLVNELESKDDPEKDTILKHKLRIEIYLGINKLGILYRMLTLNTGQTPMSSRHQIEIIYSDYIKAGIDGIKLIKETDDDTPSNESEYKFKDIIEGFTSYIERDYLTIDRTDILDNIKSLEKLAIENQGSDLFKDFLIAYDSFVKKINTLSNGWSFNDEVLDQKLSGQPFAKTALKIFNKSQVMTGFGSAIGKLIDNKAIEETSDILPLLDKINSENINEDLNTLIVRLDNIRNTAKKIGNDQRMYFHFFFRELFDKKSDGYLNLKDAINEAFTQYERKTR